MIWLTWRQLRTQTAAVYGGLLLLVIALAITGPRIADLYSQDVETFLERVWTANGDRLLYYGGIGVVYALPAVIGAFWGAPMIAHELEAGTHRLAWTQSVTRTRWLATKLGLGLLVSVGASALVSLAVTWWCAPIDKAINAGHGAGFFSVPRMDPLLFAGRGVAPIAYAAFAFVLGVTAGALIRRTVPAMAVTLVGYVVLQVALPMVVRPHLIAPEESAVPITADNLEGIRASGPGAPISQLEVTFENVGAWVHATRTVDAAGETVTVFPDWVVGCLPGPASGSEQEAALRQSEACFDRLASLGYQQEVTYHSAGQYWDLQWREAGLMAIGALALGGVCFWRVRRLS